MDNPKNILISCFACGPNWGSEVGMGWNWIINLSNHCQLYVLTETGFHEEIEKILPQLNVKFIPKFYFIDIGQKGRNLFWKQGSFIFYVHYKKWQQLAYRKALEIINSEKIDIIHQLNMTGFREPGYLWKIDKPFVWGPIGGMHNIPYRFLPMLGFYGMIFNFLRNIINSLQIKCNRRVKQASKHQNSTLISITGITQRNIKKFYGRDSVIVPELGAKITNPRILKIRSQNEPLIIIWSGIHHSRKALPLLLYALSGLRKEIKFELHILGSGNQTVKWQEIANTLKISEKCIWYGRITHEKALSVYSEGHVFCITSLLDETSTVLMEAIAAGLPVICPDHCGFSQIIDETCGFKIEVINPQHLITGIRQALEKIYANELSRQLLAKGSLEKAKQYSWDKNSERILNVYQDLLN